jgi:chromosome partitioning protein
MPVESGDFVGLSEIAAMAGVSRSAVANWRTRSPDFPKPIAELQSGPVFLLGQVRKWLRKRKKPVSNVIATINLKGGVGKTTTTVALGEILAGEYHKRVLIIDLDPQTNATTMLIGETKWKELNENGWTLAQLFKDAIADDPKQRKFNLDETLQKSVSNVRDVQTLDLLPSSLDLIDIQDQLGSMSSGRFHSDVPTDILRRAIRNILDDYEYVLIDCPPNLGIITLNGLRIADGYIIPTIPDFVSTYGIPQIKARVKQFADNIGETIEPYGVAVCKYDSRSAVHRNTEANLRKYEGPVFKTVIPQSNQIAASGEFDETSSTNTLRQKYGYAGQFEAYLSLAKDIMGVVEA